jgi:serpin B
MRSPRRVHRVPSLLLLAFVACGGSTDAPGAVDAGGPVDAGSLDGAALVPPAIAQSSVARETVSAVPPGALQAAVAANNAFAVDLFGRVRAESPAGNLITSPLSASIALTMAYAGAVGTTATQMASALHFAGAATSIFDGQNALTQELAGRAAAALSLEQQRSGGETPPSPDDYQVQVVNSVWGQKTYPWQAPFLDVLARSYGTGVLLEDFADQPDPARLAINAWVSAETGGKINDLLPQGSIDTSTRIVLVNAIHVKLPWASPFEAQYTQPGPFTTAVGHTVSTPLMNNHVTQLGYVDDGTAQIAWLPLAGNDLSVVIALPHGDLSTYEDGLAATSAVFQPPTGRTAVALSLPSLSFTSPTFSLATALKAMGMTQAFDASTADFTGMCPRQPDGNLYIGDVLQKATLAMKETGVEAAAATAVVGSSDSIAGPPPTPAVTMVVNHPFVVAIVDSTGAILFLGHIDDPTAVGGP